MKKLIIIIFSLMAMSNLHCMRFERKLDLNQSLLNAIAYNNINQVETLIADGAAVDASECHLPLHNAVYFGFKNIVELLITKIKDINATNQWGKTALHKAVEARNVEMAELLLTSGANINAQYSDGSTPLHLAVEQRQQDMVEFLISQGANKEIENYQHKKPVDLANNDAAINAIFHNYVPIANR